jgi:NAD-dependent dihydropyrimidine dehydrogenase PreA subunit
MKQKYLKNVATLTLNIDKCTGCGVCTQVCPHAVLEMRQGKAAIAALDRCMECGACTQNCAFGALEVHAGVGCASAIIKSFFTGKEPTCGCSDDDGGCC